MSNSKTGYIYTLVDPRSDDPRYVGATVNPDQRFQAHLSNPHSESLSNWIENLETEGVTPELSILSEHAVEELSAEEEEKIAELSKEADLLNSQSHSGYSRFLGSVSEQLSSDELSDAERQKVRDLLQTVDRSMEERDPVTGYEAIGEIAEMLDMGDVSKKMPLETRIGWAKKYLEDTISGIKRAEGKEALECAQAGLELLEAESR